MKLKELFADDDAVSPVIGVILMVAITVILAAVIASFVLGLGQETGDSAPSITFEDDYDGDDTLEVSVSNVGDSVDAGDVRFSGDGGDGDVSGTWADEASVGSTSSISAGDSVDVTVATNGEYDIDVIWDPGSGDSSTLTTFEGPNL